MPGPFFVEIDRPINNFYQYRYWYTHSKRPYKGPLPYIFQQSRDSEHSHSESTLGRDNCPEDVRIQAANRAYNQFFSKLGETSQIAAGIAEWRQTAMSINNNCLSLLEAARALRKGQFNKVAKALGIRKGFRPKAKEFAGRWLEYSFGWAPLVKDVYNALDVFQRPFPCERIRGRGRYKRLWRNRGAPVWNEIWRSESWDLCLVSADVRVSNPNLYVANQLGLVNPASVVWELIPFSFVVDWFTNVSQVLGSLSDTAGLELSNEFTTHYSITDSMKYVPISSPTYWYKNRFVQCYRTLGIPRPVLGLKTFTGFSVTRAANSISLLIQLLR